MNGDAPWGGLELFGRWVGWYLLSAFWQSAILLGFVALLTYLLRRRSARVRHALWAGALLLTPILPLMTWGLGKLGFPQAPIFLFPAQEGPPPGTAGPWLAAVACYAVGCVGLLGLIASQRMRVAGWLRRGRILTDHPVVAIFQQAQRRLGLERGCVLVEVDTVDSPMTLGIFYPVVALPEGLVDELSDDDLLTIALHELAHVRRNDPLLLAAASVLRAVFFFHPLVWFALRETSTLGEEIADDAVVESTRRPVPYAKMLTRLAEGIRRRMFATEMAVGIVFTKNALLRRIEAILSADRAGPRPTTRGALAAVSASACSALLVAVSFPLGLPFPLAGTRFVAREVWIPPRFTTPQGVSPDGGMVAFRSWVTGDVGVRNLEDGKERLVTGNHLLIAEDGRPTRLPPAYAEQSVFTPDARWIVTSSFQYPPVDRYALSVVGVDGSSPRILFDDPEVRWIRPCSVAPDGLGVLAYAEDADWKLTEAKTGSPFPRRRLMVVPMAGGAARILKAWDDKVEPKVALYSPDGLHIAFDLEQDGWLSPHDIHVVHLDDDDAEETVVADPADDRLIAWSPDGGSLLFSSDRMEGGGLWRLPLAEGGAPGPAELVHAPYAGRPIGVTRDGRLFDLRPHDAEDLLLADPGEAGTEASSTSQSGAATSTGRPPAGLRDHAGLPRPGPLSLWAVDNVF